jgi:DNA-binding protein HU-beta
VNKSELVEAMAKDAGISKAQAEGALNAFVNTVQAAVKKGDNVTIVGFGTFERRSRSARTGRNPRTGATLKIAASKVPAFKPGTGFKAVVSGKRGAASKAAAAKTAARKPAAAKKAPAKKAPARKPAARKR